MSPLGSTPTPTQPSCHPCNDVEDLQGSQAPTCSPASPPASEVPSLCCSHTRLLAAPPSPRHGAASGPLPFPLLRNVHLSCPSPCFSWCFQLSEPLDFIFFVVLAPVRHDTVFFYLLMVCLPTVEWELLRVGDCVSCVRGHIPRPWQEYVFSTYVTSLVNSTVTRGTVPGVCLSFWCRSFALTDCSVWTSQSFAFTPFCPALN